LGKVALVTGAAGGIGSAVSVALVSQGCRVAMVDLDTSALSAVRHGLEEEARRIGTEVHGVVADVTTEDGARTAVEGTTDVYGRLDVLVNVVGGSRPGNDVVETELADWEDMLRFNLTSTFLMCRSAMPHLAAAGAGAVVNVSSGAGVRGMRRNPGYCAAKAGVIGLTKALAIDHADSGVRVNAVAPGPVLTPLMRRNRSVEEIESMGRLALVGRVADPREVAAAVVFLASDEASYVNGQTVEVDGGVRGGV
jgi:NAD(P)-dependent dehydrogenase (short-subunit alcohol dehydrogenase family)